MKTTNELKHDTIEKLATLWTNNEFKELVKCLRLTQDKYAKLCLTRSSWEDVQRLQWEAAGISIVIKTVEDAFNKVNGDK